MEQLYTSRLMSRVFRGLVLALAVVLVACGSDSDEPEPTTTTTVSQEQEALPTVPPVEGTPDTSVSEEEITVLEPEIPATAQASTPDVTEELVEAETVEDDLESSPAASPDDIVADAEATAPTDATVESEVEVETEVIVGTPPPDESIATTEVVEVESTPTEAEPERTGNETFNNPGDGTGGSGMPGERDSNEPTDGDPIASPEASPIAQLTISGCEVPDVPGFLGDSNIFVLTADVNFRSGPGVTCDPIFEEPIGDGQIVLVLGGPVTQADDGTEWVQIEVNGEPGWITNDFLEPAE